VADVQIGGRTVDYDRATRWIDVYFDAKANRVARKPYAYPAYDGLITGSGPEELNDGDLFAPTALNAAPTIAALYSLQSVRDDLEAGLGQVPTDLTLEAAVADGTLENRLGNLVSVRDRDGGLRGVRLTTLLKVLHRKRPLFIPLYDQFVKMCYVGPKPAFPIPSRSRSTTAAYAIRLAQLMCRDMESPTFARVAGAAPTDVSPLRVLDVLAWRLSRED